MHTMHTITLYRGSGCWMARHSNPIVKEMFGTADIPTAWTDRADPEKVRHHVAGLNPDCAVVLEKEVDSEIILQRQGRAQGAGQR